MAAGRPIVKENRKKVGLSLIGNVNDKLTELSAMTGKTKSRIVEEAVHLFSERQAMVDARIKDIKEYGDMASLSAKDILEERLRKEEEVLKGSLDSEVKHVG